MPWQKENQLAVARQIPQQNQLSKKIQMDNALKPKKIVGVVSLRPIIA